MHLIDIVIKIMILTSCLSTGEKNGALSYGTDSLKCWEEGNKLIWTDFKGTKPNSQELSPLKAISAIKIIPLAVRKNGKLHYDIKLSFARYESWIIEKSEQLLKHEQLHFDIGELSVRKLRKKLFEISEVKLNPTYQDFFPAIEAAYHETAQMHEAYDNETSHGLIIEIQNEWEARVNQELNSLRQFSSSMLGCK
ncbi:MAG: DUF922 domain-containing protein [Cyclobacteriaceae bacterium]|nr:DUF922 domain-containing protein [Cyclobacteriaceae bacterium]